MYQALPVTAENIRNRADSATDDVGPAINKEIKLTQIAMASSYDIVEPSSETPEVHLARMQLLFDVSMLFCRPY